MKDDPGIPRLWITYPWTEREEGDFAYLVSQLKEVGIQATYDAIEIRPDFQLADWIDRKLACAEVDGWAYVLTPLSVTRRPSASALAHALESVLSHKGTAFPIVGLFHGVALQYVLPALRLLPCFHLTDSDWKRGVAAVIKCGGGRIRQAEETRFVWTIHSGYGGDPEVTAIEVGVRLESIPYWRFAIPRSTPAVKWGQGPRGGGEISPIKFSVVRGSGRMGNHDVTWFGAANAVSPTESAYAVFQGHMPEFICFGPAQGPQGPPEKMEIFRAGSQRSCEL